MKFQLFIACLVLYSQMTQATAAEEQQPTSVRQASSGATFEISTISADHAACMEDTHAMSSNESSLCSCMESATKNGMNSFRVDSGVCYIYLASPPANDTGTQQIYVARNPAPGSVGAPVCAEKCCKDGNNKTAAGRCLVMEQTNQLKWDEARQQCKKTPGSRLVEAPTPEIIEELYQYIKKNGGTDYFWVGLKRNSTDVWAWVESGAHSTSLPWYGKAPYINAGKECGVFHRYSSTKKPPPTLTNYKRCNSERSYICSGLPATRFCPAGK